MKYFFYLSYLMVIDKGGRSHIEVSNIIPHWSSKSAYIPDEEYIYMANN